MSSTVKTNVKLYIASFSNMNPNILKDDYVLKDHPIKLDDIKLGFLAIALRGYVKSLKEDQTVLAAELRKKGLTVKGTYEMIIEKSGL